MKLGILPIGIVVCFLMTVSCHQKDRLQLYLESLPPSLIVSLHIQDGEGAVLASQNPDRQVPSASIIKVPILIELMNQVEAGILSLDQELVMLEEDVVSGAGELQFHPAGTSFTLDFLAREMIRISDNVATNLLIQRVGLAAIQRWLTENGYSFTQLNRLMMDFDAVAAGRQNYTSAREISHLLANLSSGAFVSKQSTDFIMELLVNCADGSTIPSKLPSTVRVAHKTGTLDYVRGDAGIILGDNPLTISVFVEGFESMEQAESVIGEVAKLAWEIHGN